MASRFGLALRSAVQVFGSQRAAARELDVAEGTLRRYIKGERPTRETLSRLVQVFERGVAIQLLAAFFEDELLHAGIDPGELLIRPLREPRDPATEKLLRTVQGVAEISDETRDRLDDLLRLSFPTEYKAAQPQAPGPARRGATRRLGRL